MTEYKKIITNKGLELITSSSLNGEELVIKSIIIGDANGENYEPTAAQTSLVHQKNELQISEMIVNSETSYTFLAQIPNDIDYYVIREIGLLDENDNLLEITQMEQETYIQSDNLIQQLTVGIRFDVGQSSTVVVLADTNIETASKDFVNDNFQNLNEKNQANGYAGLDANSKLPLANLPEHTHNQYLTEHQSLSSCANTNLNNLTETGKSNFMKLAYELDYDNAILVSTTNSHTFQSYTATTDGILVAFAYGTSAVSARIRNDGGNYNLSQLYSTNTTGYINVWFPILKGETLEYEIFATGGSPAVKCTFIPFKKS